MTAVLLSSPLAFVFGATRRQSTMRHSPIPNPLSSFICLRDLLRLICTPVMMHPLHVVGFTRGCTPENPAACGEWRADQGPVLRTRTRNCWPILTAARWRAGFIGGVVGFGAGRALGCSRTGAFLRTQRGPGRVGGIPPPDHYVIFSRLVYRGLSSVFNPPWIHRLQSARWRSGRSGRRGDRKRTKCCWGRSWVPTLAIERIARMGHPQFLGFGKRAKTGRVGHPPVDTIRRKRTVARRPLKYKRE